MSQIEIIHAANEEEPFLIINKASGIPSAPLKEGDLSAFSLAADLYPQIKNIKSKKSVEGGLIHRIDNDTKGLILIAASQSFYDHLCSEQEKGLFTKRYEALCCKNECEPDSSYARRNFSVKEGEEIIVKSYFRSYGPKSCQVRPVTEDSGKYALKKTSSAEYETRICITKKGDFYRARCFLTKGYRHQVRCHLAWCGYPISGDRIYNPSSNQKEFLFTADGLYFSWNGKKYSFEL